MMKKRRTNSEKAAIVANIIAIAIVATLAIPFVYQAWVNAWIVKQTTFSVLKQDRQHLQEEHTAQDATPEQNVT